MWHRVEDGVIWSHAGESVYVQAWGRDSIRIRAAQHKIEDELPGALVEPPPSQPNMTVTERYAVVENGQIRAELSSSGRLRFFRDEALLLEEIHKRPMLPNAHTYLSTAAGRAHTTLSFEAYEGERFYGLGQHRHGRLDQKGCVIDLVQNNSQIAIPFLLSSRGYGFLWNNPAIGRVELGMDQTRWVAESTQQIDYVITTGESYTTIMQRYADLTGYPPMMPEWAAGFWQSRCRYMNQNELLAVAEEHHRRGLPMSVILVDYLHWERMGDWRFKHEDWHDPAGMVSHLEELGIKTMVSFWPTANRNSLNYPKLVEHGLLLRTQRGVPAVHCFIDTGTEDWQYFHYYDPSNSEARAFVWQQIQEHYYQLGIKHWWLDACEPAINPKHHDNLMYAIGDGLEVGCLYPLLNAQTFYDGLIAAGETEILNLSRSAWAGIQRYGIGVWSGDIEANFETLRDQVRAGLNIALSGIPWWTSDTGGFFGGHPDSPYFRELLVRWFQFSTFCPILRLHGYREPYHNVAEGGDNEVWTFGEEVYHILSDLLHLRERLKPYILEQMRTAHEKGTPVMRPLFFDFAHDSNTYSVDDQYMFGDQLLVAPVLYQGAQQRRVYLPAGEKWRSVWTREVMQGGQWVEIATPLTTIPVFVRGDFAQVSEVFKT